MFDVQLNYVEHHILSQAFRAQMLIQCHYKSVLFFPKSLSGGIANIENVKTPFNF
jgi:hypothetical protein